MDSLRSCSWMNTAVSVLAPPGDFLQLVAQPRSSPGRASCRCSTRTVISSLTVFFFEEDKSSFIALETVRGLPALRAIIQSPSFSLTHSCSPVVLSRRDGVFRYRHERSYLRLVPYPGNPAGRILRSSVQLPDRCSLTRDHDPQAYRTHPVHPHPRSRHDEVLPTMPMGGTTGTLCTAAMEILSGFQGRRSSPRCMRGFRPGPVARDGASVQSFYGTVIILRMIYLYIYFVVENTTTTGRSRTGHGRWSTPYARL